MKINLINLTNEEICEFLLSGKKADTMELNPERSRLKKTGFNERVVYKDKSMEIIFSYLKIADDNIIQQFFIYSNWWGKIKNSFFTCEGFKGKSETKCGVVNINGLQPFNYKGDAVTINNKNEIANIEITDFNSLVLYCHRKFKTSPNYEVIEVISQAPNSWVKIQVNMPDGKYFAEGSSKKEAANKFAVEYAKKLF